MKFFRDLIQFYTRDNEWLTIPHRVNSCEVSCIVWQEGRRTYPDVKIIDNNNVKVRTKYSQYGVMVVLEGIYWDEYYKYDGFIPLGEGMLDE